MILLMIMILIYIIISVHGTEMINHQNNISSIIPKNKKIP